MSRLDHVALFVRRGVDCPELIGALKAIPGLEVEGFTLGDSWSEVYARIARMAQHGGDRAIPAAEGGAL